MKNRLPLNAQNIVNTVTVALLKKKIVKNYKTYCTQKYGHALLYYKTDPFTPLYSPSYSHPNQWEILAIARALNELGYWVDILDRSITPPFSLKDKYQIFIGSSSGSSTRFFPEISEQVPSAIKILYATTAHPIDHTQRIRQRYAEFYKRTKHQMKPRRLATSVNMQAITRHAEYIFSVGNDTTNKTYKKCGLPLHKIQLSTYPGIILTRNSIEKKKSNHFLFLAGSGNIGKGLDIALEVFSGTPDCHLHVYTKVEKEILNTYKSTINTSPNIHLHGFVDIKGKEFQKAAETCAFVFSPSCTEGMSTSVLTAMRKGCIPITTPETGVDIDSFGISIDTVDIQALSELVIKAAQMPKKELRQRTSQAFHQSQQYTQEQFYNSIHNALTAVMLERILT